MPYWVYLAIANAAIMVIEYFYRTGQFGSFWQALPIIILPILVGQWGLYNGFQLAPSIFTAGIVFTIVNQLLRIGNALILGETVTAYQVVGVLLMVCASFIVKMK